MKSYFRLFSAAVILALCPASPAAAEPITSRITSDFNGTPIAGNDFIWFSSVIHLSGGVPTTPFTTSIRDASIRFSAGGTNYTLSVPDAVITFDGTAKATTTFRNGGFVTETNPSFSGNAFLAGLAFRVPLTGFSGGIKSLTWTADFYASKPGVDVHWQWAAAGYTSFGTDYNTLGIKPADAPGASRYPNSDHAGTPEAYKGFVVGGARGGGGSNATGSYSGTADVRLPTGPGVDFAPEPPSVLLAGLGLIGGAFLLARRRRAPVDWV
jgi:LPXTG-motif cell wall-anchored protein